MDFKKFLPLAATVALGAAAAQGAVTVEPETSLGRISPYVYGANYSAFGIVSFDQFDLARDSGLTFLRWPGGFWSDSNDIRPLQIDRLMGTASVMGDPVVNIHVRVLDGTPEAAAELVRYTNMEKGYDLRYWGIGNEPSLYHDYTVERFSREWREIAHAMLAVDPDLILMGPDPHQWTGLEESTPRDSEGVEWVRGFLEVNGDMVDIVSVHRYPFPRSQANPVTTVAELRENTLEWTHLISRLRAIAEEVTGRDDLLYGVTEANSHWSATIGGEASNDSLFSAIWWADVLGKLIADGADIVLFFDLQSSDGRGGWGLLSERNPRPSYYVYQLYQRFGEELLAAHSTEEFVSAYAARREDGALTLILTNLNDDPRTLELDLGDPDAVLAEALLLDPDHRAAPVEDPRSADGRSVTLPAHSALLLVFAAAGD